MKSFGQGIMYIIVVVTWLAGIVLTKGFWMTVAAICIPPYAWYLLVERAMQVMGVV